MKRSITAAVTTALLVLASALPAQAAAACLAELSAPAAMPSCCQHAAPHKMTCEGQVGGSRAPLTMKRPCCCDHEPAAPPSPTETATTVPNELSAALASPLTKVAMNVPTAKGLSPAPTADVETDETPPVFLLACSFLI